jgi:hypothetical protein
MPLARALVKAGFSVPAAALQAWEVPTLAASQAEGEQAGTWE